MARRYRSYTDQELVDALRSVNDDLGMAGYRYSEADRGRKAYWRNRVRSLGHRKRSICGEMARRGLLHDPRGRWSHARQA